MVYCWNWILPDQIFRRNLCTLVTGLRSHVTVCQFEPSTCKCICEVGWILVEFTRHFFVCWIKTHGQVRGQHKWLVELARNVCIRDDGFGIHCLPLLCASRAVYHLPLVFK